MALCSSVIYVVIGSVRALECGDEVAKGESAGPSADSSGGLFDPNFRHTVVLVGEHNEDGALGVVLNRALDVTVESTLPALGDLVPTGELLFQGGPVQPANPVLLAQLTDPELADIHVFGSVGFLVGELSRTSSRGFSRRGCLRATRMGAGPARGRDGRRFVDHRSRPARWTSSPMRPICFGVGCSSARDRNTGDCPGCRTTPR